MVGCRKKRSRFYVIFPAFHRHRNADSMHVYHYTLAFEQDLVPELCVFVNQYIQTGPILRFDTCLLSYCSWRLLLCLSLTFPDVKARQELQHSNSDNKLTQNQISRKRKAISTGSKNKLQTSSHTTIKTD